VAGAKEIHAAYHGFGSPEIYEPLLVEALRALPLDFDERLLIHIARLGAEAFVLDVHFNVLEDSRFGYVDDLDRLGAGRFGQDERFLNFVIRRPIELSSAPLTPEIQELQMMRAIVLFLFIRDELERGWPRYGSEAVMLEYRALLFKLVEKHYQLLQDGLFANTRGSRYKGAVDELDRLFEITKATKRKFTIPPNSRDQSVPSRPGGRPAH